MVVRAIATPGHTFTHLSYALAHDGEPVGVFTGGSLLFGATGRPDLLGPDRTPTSSSGSSTPRRTASPTSCPTRPRSSRPTVSAASAPRPSRSRPTSTIGQEKKTNPVLTESEEDYVRELLAGLDAYPAYYAHMGPANAAGPTAPDLSPPHRADAGELRRRIEAGEWVVDLRNRTAFAAGHAPGTLNFGLDGQFATYLGWLIEWGTPLTLLGETEEQVAEAQRELVRIGIDRPEASATGSPQDWSTEPLGTFPVATFADLDEVRHHRPVVVLDVRRTQEFEEARIEGAVNIPIHELPAGWPRSRGRGLGALRRGLPRVGRRLLPRRRTATLVAIDDTFDNAESAGLHLVTHETKGER